MRESTVFERNQAPEAWVTRALEGSRQRAFWLDDVAGAERRPALSADLDADLAIVGGGYTGLWTALLAARRDPGARIVLLEGGTVGWAASGRNGGFCEASLTHGEENGRRRWPEEFDRLEELGRQNLDAIESTLAELGIDADFERTGSLDVAVEPHQLDWLEAGPEDVLLDQQQVRAEVDSPTYLGGVWHRGSSALVHPAKLAVGLARAAEEAGVVLHERTVVRSVADDGASGRVVLVTDQARVRARRVVLATNAFPSLLRRNRLMTVPVYDYALMTEPLSGEQKAALGWRNRQGVSDLGNQFHYYRLSADDRLLFGGYDAIYPTGGRMSAAHENRDASFRRLASHVLTTFPQLEDVRFSHRWAGAIDTSTRFCAFWGTARGGRVAYATGFTGLGVGATRFAAQVLLDLLDGVETERTSLRMVREKPLPFPPEPFASIGINATRWSLDRADHRGGRRNLLLRTLDALGLGFDS
ncbi:NAD(P)/FAD-dependent oxidoreductase [Actinotalea sp.]|uniref:NAD(P)/FAD-dependent oxidoreductase n=1 Tax=Actinotalea sp. TaxID=1872145 RepID=UPI00356802C0